MPAKLSKYQNYKPSGLDWLGDIPAEWEVKRLKDIITIKNGSDYKHIETDFGIPVIGSGGQFRYASKHIYNGESILFGRKGTIDKPLYIVGKFWTVDTMFYSVLNRCIFGQFLYYFALKIPFQGYSTQTALPSITQTVLEGICLGLPNKQTQIKIAKYLDQQTANIDKEIDLLTQKTQKYKLLKQTLISETVTKGLDKTAKLKPSGVEWIGDIPEGWEVRRTKEVFEITRGRVIAQTELEDSGYAVYSSQTENDGCMGFIKTYDYNANLLTWTTDGVNAGTVFIRSGKFNCTNICGILLPKNKNKNYLKYLIHSVQLSAKHNKRIDTNGAKIMSNEMAFIKIIIPTKSEQIAIADYLDLQTGKIDQIIFTINQKITKLKDYRKVLINDVVTGKFRFEEEQETQPIVEIKVNLDYKANQSFDRAVLSAYLIDKQLEDNTFGMVKFAKEFHFIDSYYDLGYSEYYRHPQGPHNKTTLISIKNILKQNKWFETKEDGNRTYFKPLEKRENFKKYLDARLGTILNQIDEIISKLRDWNTESWEILSTTFAVWNDYLIDGKHPTDEEIVKEIHSNWNESKLKIPEERWLKCIKWMKSNNLVPLGKGKKTILKK